MSCTYSSLTKYPSEIQRNDALPTVGAFGFWAWVFTIPTRLSWPPSSEGGKVAGKKRSGDFPNLLALVTPEVWLFEGGARPPLLPTLKFQVPLG